MKMISILEVDDNTYDELTLTNKEGFNLVFRPLPEVMEESIPYQVSETEVDSCQDPFASGWNACLKAIIGET